MFNHSLTHRDNCNIHTASVSFLASFEKHIYFVGVDVKYCWEWSIPTKLPVVCDLKGVATTKASTSNIYNTVDELQPEVLVGVHMEATVEAG